MGIIMIKHLQMWQIWFLNPLWIAEIWFSRLFLPLRNFPQTSHSKEGFTFRPKWILFTWSFRYQFEEKVWGHLKQKNFKQILIFFKKRLKIYHCSLKSNLAKIKGPETKTIYSKSSGPGDFKNDLKFCLACSHASH